MFCILLPMIYQSGKKYYIIFYFYDKIWMGEYGS